MSEQMTLGLIPPEPPPPPPPPRKVLPCGHLDLGDTKDGGRPWQCVCEYERWTA